MKKLILAVTLTLAAGQAVSSGCGIPPIPPIPPIGTTHCDPVCVMDQYGNAHWQFICR